MKKWRASGPNYTGVLQHAVHMSLHKRRISQLACCVLLIDEGAFSIPFLPGSLPLTAAAAPDRLVYVSYLKLCLKVPEVVEWTGHGRLYVAAPSLSGRSDFSIPTIFHPAFHPAIRHRKAACAGNVSSHQVVRPPFCGPVAVSRKGTYWRFLVWFGPAVDHTSE